MELVKPEIAKSEGRIPQRSSSRGRRGTTNAEASLQWVTARVPIDLIREIEAHAKRNGTTRSEAIRECVAVGLETIQNRESIPDGRVEELLGGIESVRVLLELLGPPTFGIQRLLAHWASRDRAVHVNEDELIAEVRAVSADEWEQAVTEAERDVARAKNLGPHKEG
jgi:hypothetical protein